MGGAIASVLALTNRARAALAWWCISLVTFNWAFIIRVLPSFERYKPVPPLSRRDSASASPKGTWSPTTTSRCPSMVYYLRRHIDILFDREAFLQLLRGDRRVFAVLSAV